ncbi:hypothetical protein [Aliarcobacter cryaerophilus]|jgi:hypothetical protein|uniref:hypothetical protein n=1 Tax=Aliarcobacter cryaerophilus TaxID=28198 RepID=UPI0011E070D4|nr:hypothetical protein [Aliarcobacter cryaerophilus]
MEILAIAFLFLGLLGASFLWSFKEDKFFKKEAKRCLNNFCEVDENWNSNGKVYTKGLAVIEENEKKRFIKQAKVCDIGILN